MIFGIPVFFVPFLFLKLLTIPTIIVQFLERNYLWIPPLPLRLKKNNGQICRQGRNYKSGEARPRLGELGGQIRLLCICVVDLYS